MEIVRIDIRNDPSLQRNLFNGTNTVDSSNRLTQSISENRSIRSCRRNPMRETLQSTEESGRLFPPLRFAGHSKKKTWNVCNGSHEIANKGYGCFASVFHHRFFFCRGHFVHAGLEYFREILHFVFAGIAFIFAENFIFLQFVSAFVGVSANIPNRNARLF